MPLPALICHNTLIIRFYNNLFGQGQALPLQYIINNQLLSENMKKAACILIGGTGYGAKEFLRLSSQNRNIKITQVISKSAHGKRLEDVHQEFGKLFQLQFDSKPDLSGFDKFQHRFIILALPHGESLSFFATHKKQIRDMGIHVIDLSGDFRLKNMETRNKYYGKLPDEISSEDYQSFTYGLSEINKDAILRATHIANPGCYPTATLLALHPITAGCKIRSIAVDGKSGSSGAGRTPSQAFHHPESNSNSFPYKVLEHRHEPEMIEHGKIPSSSSFMFVPHVIPLSRGMLITAYIELEESISETDIRELYHNTYKDSPFIRIRETPPQIRHVAGSNFCDLHVQVRDKQVVTTSCIDNLVKGMAGQAIQNINLMCGLEETEGLHLPGLGLL